MLLVPARYKKGDEDNSNESCDPAIAYATDIGFGGGLMEVYGMEEVVRINHQSYVVDGVTE